MIDAKSPRERLLETPELWVAPAIHASTEFPGTGNIRGLFFDGLPWKGKPTRAFAWLGIPESASQDRPVPGVVLVHGGGGCAFAEWVKLWVDRGYAAIAMDTCGTLPTGADAAHPRHADGGPSGWGGFDQGAWPMQDQWTYHAMADVMLAHSLLRAQPQVDAARIGITGISWGGVLTCNVVGVDDRLACAVPVYGCGYLHEASAFVGNINNPEAGPNWAAWWDPSAYLPHAKCPMLWVTGSNDFAFPLHALRRSRELVGGRGQLSVRLRMDHGHGGPGENPAEIHAFMNQHLRGDAAYLALNNCHCAHGRMSATYTHTVGELHAEILFTRDKNNWPERKWESLPAQIDASTHTISAAIPDGASACFLNLCDSRNCVVSSDVQCGVCSYVS